MTARSLIAKKLSWLIAAAFVVAAATPALSHGSLSMDDDLCTLSLGKYVIHFAGYQPLEKRDPSRYTEFCEDIPATGQTFVVLDLIDSDLRKLPISVRVLEDQGRANDEVAPVVFEMPRENHPTGSFSYRHTFEKPGKYVGLITAGGGSDQLVARFPFSVGKKPENFWNYVFYAIAGLALTIGLIMFGLRSHNKILDKAGLQ
jgi:hypothetical protein